MPLKLETGKLDKFRLVSYRKETPDGTLFVQIFEDDNGELMGLDLQIGKSGSSIRSYLSVISGLINLSIEKKISIHSVLEIISNQTSDKIRVIDGGKKQVKSAMEALFYVLTAYNAEKYAEEDEKKHRKVGYFTNPRKRA